MAERVCFYRFPLAMRDFLKKIPTLRKEGDSIETLWVSPELGAIKVGELLTLTLPEPYSPTEHSLDDRKRAVIYLGGFKREDLSVMVQLFRKAIAGNFDVIFSAQTEINVKWSFDRLWHDVTEDHAYFEELERAHKEGRPFTLVPDDDKPTSL